MPAKRAARATTERAIDRVSAALATRARGLKKTSGNNASKMRAFGDDLRLTIAAGSDLRRAIDVARTSSAERWPRGQRVGVDDDEEARARRADDLRARLSSGRASARTGGRERSSDLRDRIGGGRGGSGRKGASDRRGGSGDAARRLLRALDLERYAEVFEREEIDLDALRAMRERDFTKLGIPYGPMVKITRALGR